ncbi:MAG: PIN domain-containing protein [Methanothrix sp.]|nr:PIN domain-containing protein [Methanothrix sp.]
MIFVDTNVLYSVLVKTKFSKSAQDIILMPSDLATSATVLSELVFISLRKLCKERYGTNNYSEFRRAIVHNGYNSFKEDLDLIFRLIEERDILVLPINDNLDDWSNAMIRYNLMPNDAMIASTCLKHEISKIATFDSDFLRVDWLSVINQSK